VHSGRFRLGYVLRTFVVMTTKTRTQPRAVPIGDSRVQASLNSVKKSFTAYGVLSTIGLVAVIVVAGTGHTVSTFMWVRGILLPVIAVLLYLMTVAAARGSYGWFDRVRALTIIEPIAIIGIDLIPGVCPAWYAVLQAICMVPVIVAAVAIRGSALRAAFPKKK
jgi:hypothetical protein